jgi:hypothetical protein
LIFLTLLGFTKEVIQQICRVKMARTFPNAFGEYSPASYPWVNPEIL